MYRMAKLLSTAHLKRFARRYCALHFGCVFLFAILYWIPDLFEQYNQDTGDGQRNHPFAGWSALVLLAIAEIY